MCPSTRWTGIFASREGDEAQREAAGALLATYWKPAYLYLRRKGLSVEASELATQSLFVRLLEGDLRQHLDPSQGRFRAYLLAALEDHLRNHRESGSSGEGGPPTFVRLDTPVAETDLLAAPEDPGRAFDREWALGVMERALVRLEQRYEEGRHPRSAEAVLRFFRLDHAPSYVEAATEAGMTVAQLKAVIHRARERFREVLREEIGTTVGGDEETEDEMRALVDALAALTPACPRCGIRYPEGRLAVCPRCLIEAEVPPALLGGSIELIEEVGRGGMGTVWKARHLRLGRTVAVKFLAGGLETDSEFARRFEREAQALARLSHVGIVTVHDLGTEEGRPYIVMEYVDGQPLSEIVPVPVERARDVALEVLDALAYAHDRGIVHRDVKPHNILIDRSGRVKVSDFGIARLLGPEPSGVTVTNPGEMIGTPGYIAPEALAGARPDPRMDVFAVGVVLHEMVTGRRPSGRLDALPAHLQRIVGKAVTPDPQERYASATEMRADLAASTAVPESALPAPGTLPPEERHWLHAVALTHTLAATAVLWAFLLSVTPRLLEPGAAPLELLTRSEVLPDGRIVSRARFETWPILAAVAAVVVALVAQGLLRRHWRQASLDEPQPDQPVSESAAVLGCGVLALAIFGLHRLLARSGHLGASYVTIAGGLIELTALFLACTTVLQAWRTARPLRQEPRFWLGLGLAAVPPLADLAAFLGRWKP